MSKEVSSRMTYTCTNVFTWSVGVDALLFLSVFYLFSYKYNEINTMKICCTKIINSCFLN